MTKKALKTKDIRIFVSNRQQMRIKINMINIRYLVYIKIMQFFNLLIDLKEKIDNLLVL